eukprot:TRINITY_DN73863_c0_g1_i1.p1 TRINITY_DN73863_c0_g1~~TRINITY_DN73863_c0_g1_i1.p1  ORF type:complete len:159 (+),score=13.68 TRINITY_DN73863_c0_g1_i1:117-593(+)
MPVLCAQPKEPISPATTVSSQIWLPSLGSPTLTSARNTPLKLPVVSTTTLVPTTGSKDASTAPPANSSSTAPPKATENAEEPASTTLSTSASTPESTPAVLQISPTVTSATETSTPLTRTGPPAAVSPPPRRSRAALTTPETITLELPGATCVPLDGD